MGQAVYEFSGPTHRFLQSPFQQAVCDEIYEGAVGARSDGDGGSIRMERGSTLPIKTYAVRARMTTTMRRTHGHVREGGERFYILWLVEKGMVSISCANGMKTLTEDMIMVTDASQPLFVQALIGDAGEHRNKVALIPSHLLHAHVGDCARLNAMSFAAADGDGKIVAKLIDLLFETGDLLDREDGVAMLRLLLNAIGRLVGAPDATRNERRSMHEVRLDQISSAIALHLTNPRLVLADVAHMCGISPRYLSRVLRQAGTSFATMLREARLAEARNWLSAGNRPDHSIAEIARIVGYSSGAQLSRCFHARFACTPRAFRRQAAGQPQPTVEAVELNWQ